MSTTALIPARAGSERIPDKNFRDIHGESLVSRAATLALAAGLPTVVSTDAPQRVTPLVSGEVLVLRRPNHLAVADAPVEGAIEHMIASCRLKPDDTVLLLQPTSPLRSLTSLTSFLAAYETHRPRRGSAFSVSEDYEDYWYEGADGALQRVRDLLPDEFASRRSQSRRPLLRENGLFYAMNVSWFGDNRKCVTSDSLPVLTPPKEDLDINTPEDWKLAERHLPSMRES